MTSQSSSSSVIEQVSSSSSSSSDAETFWLSAPIEHGQIARSTKLGATVIITGEYDNIEPLRLLCPPLRLPAQLNVQIWETDVSMATPTLIFQGIARKPEQEDRKVKVSCSEWGDALEQKIPAFFIQTECNYRVFDSGTCKLDRTALEVDVTITAANGRTVVASGAGLSGKDASYFAQGWLESGTGLDGNIRFILESAAADGQQVTLTLSDPLTLDVPLTATLTPGCDGLYQTCNSKFGNLVNFGGHITPRENLALIAIKTNATTGGKK